MRSGQNVVSRKRDGRIEQRGDRGVAERQSAAGQGDGEAALPEAARLPDAIGETVDDEDVHRGRATLRVVLGTEDAADADALELHRRAEGDRSRARTFEDELAAGLRRIEHG